MKSYTPRELRAAVLLAVVLTIVAMLALLDPSCHHAPPVSGTSRALRVH